MTCGNLGWKNAIIEYLDGLIAGTITLETGQRVMWIALTEHYDELDPPVPEYHGALNTLSNHIRKCEYERWKKVEALRAGGGAS